MRSRTAGLAAMLAVAPLGAKAARRAEHGLVARRVEREGAIDVISGLVRWFGGLVSALALLLGIITGPCLAQSPKPTASPDSHRKSASFWS